MTTAGGTVTTSLSSRLVERGAKFLETRLSRRSFLVRSTFAATALAVAPKRYVLEPRSAYEAFCSEPQCGSENCACDSNCCEGFSTFCCTINDGYNWCPDNSIVGGWWAAAGSPYCDTGTRYYLDCNATCDTEPTCDCALSDCDNWVTGCIHFRYGQCNTDVSCVGPILCRLVSCTPPWELAFDCDSTWAVDNSTADMNSPCNTSVPAPPCDSEETLCETVGIEGNPAHGGYWIVTSFGKVLAFGDVQSYGDREGKPLPTPVVAIRATATGEGYWLTAEDGSVWNYGDAQWHGSAVHRKLAVGIVDMAPLPDGTGYYLVTGHGHVLSYGQAESYGSVEYAEEHEIVTGIDTTATGKGYFVLAASGRVFAFGDAVYLGDPLAQGPAYPVVSIRRSHDGKGYYLLGQKGAVWAYGDAKDRGQPYGKTGSYAAVGLALSDSGLGYWVTLTDGAIFVFGEAGYHGGGNE
jgi:hypothetical protein